MISFIKRFLKTPKFQENANFLSELPQEIRESIHPLTPLFLLDNIPAMQRLNAITDVPGIKVGHAKV
jgi:hypothetical protein